MKAFKTIIIVIVPLATGLGCHSPSPEQQRLNFWAERKAELATVNTADGVNATEAKTLAWLYFGRVFGACGVTSTAADDGERWKFFTAVGAVGLPAAPIYVSKQAGKIECERGPTVTNLQNLVDSDDTPFLSRSSPANSQ